MRLRAVAVGPRNYRSHIAEHAPIAVRRVAFSKTVAFSRFPALCKLTWEYVTAKGTCLVCKLRAFCTRSRSGRTIHRHREQQFLNRARKIANSKAAKDDLKRRQHLIERSFADAANRHGFKRARWRGLWKQAIQDLLIATVQNLRKLVRHLCQTNPELAYRCVELLRRLSRLLLDRLPALLPI